MVLFAMWFPASLLFMGACVLFARRKTAASFLQLLGAAGLLVVVLTHVAEAVNVLPQLHWGSQHSIGHFLDLGAAITGLTLFPLGYLLHTLSKH